MATEDDYFYTDATLQIVAGCKVTPIIDGRTFAQELTAALGAVTGPGDFIFVHGWFLPLTGGAYEPSRWGLLNPLTSDGVSVTESVIGSFVLPINGTPTILVNFLKDRFAAGVDVRVMGWSSALGMGSAFTEGAWFSGLAPINAMTCNTISDLRQPGGIGAHAAVNLLGHAAGATHLKMWVIGNADHAVGFTGGLDMAADRFCSQEHATEDDLWHDIVVKVEGPAVQKLYDAYKQMWDLNASRAVYRLRFNDQDFPNFLPGTPVIVNRTLSTTPVGDDRVQSLRTIPAANYSILNCFRTPEPVPFAPAGRFEVRLAWEKAISTADTYIYMEDQSFWSQDVMRWINTRMREPGGSNLKVILLMPGRVDPADPAFPQAQYLNESLNNNLLDGLDASGLGRVRLFTKMGPTSTHDIVVHPIEQDGTLVRLQSDILIDPVTGPSTVPKNAFQPLVLIVGGEFLFVEETEPASRGEHVVLRVHVQPGGTIPDGKYVAKSTRGITVHAKTTLIDDKWAIIGSANCMRRSLFTDWEHSLSFANGSSNVVRNYRMNLWAEHFHHPTPGDFLDLQNSLNRWDPNWGTPGGAPPQMPERAPGDPGPPFLNPIILPIDGEPITHDNQQSLDVYDDTDSRDTWGSLCEILASKVPVV